MLGARVQGDALVVTRDSVDVVVAATARPGWRFTVDAPTLGRLRLEAGLGASTLLAGEVAGAPPAITRSSSSTSATMTVENPDSSATTL